MENIQNKINLTSTYIHLTQYIRRDMLIAEFHFSNSIGIQQVQEYKYNVHKQQTHTHIHTRTENLLQLHAQERDRKYNRNLVGLGHWEGARNSFTTHKCCQKLYGRSTRGFALAVLSRTTGNMARTSAHTSFFFSFFLWLTSQSFFLENYKLSKNLFKPNLFITTLWTKKSFTK